MLVAKSKAADFKVFNHLYLPIAICAALGVLCVTPGIRQNSTLLISLLSASACLAFWFLVLVAANRKALASFSLRFLPRQQHYLQALVQISVFGYWGYYWSPVFEHASLIVAQLLFAYAFDMLLSWTRGRQYVLGFGPLPIIFSINLFLWFKDDWFYLQFIMIAIGFMGKEFIRWSRDGQWVHIFNPSAFALGLFSLLLIVTGTTDLTWGQEIASTLTLAPSIYLFLFLVGLVVMYFFAITLVAMTAAATLFGLSAIYSAIQGVPYFLDSEIPAAVFLGLHLLITDPSTSPRSLFGKAIFGSLYGLGVFGLYALLTLIGVPTFYDKLLCVPLLNLSVIGIDRFAKLVEFNFTAKSKWLSNLSWGRLNLSFMAIWIIFFGLMAMLGKTDAMHEGDSVPYWESACAENKSHACERLVLIEQSYCTDGSAWACNEIGIHQGQGIIGEKNTELALSYFLRACELRFQAACQNLLQPDGLLHSRPKMLDLRLMLREGGQNLMTMEESELMRRACVHGWQFACISQDL